MANINKKYFLLRFISFPIFLIFNILFSVLIGITSAINWLLHGGQMLFYGRDNGKSLVDLIEQNREIIEHLKQ